MDWLYGMDESEVAKKHNVDVETVTKLSNECAYLFLMQPGTVYTPFHKWMT